MLKLRVPRWEVLTAAGLAAAAPLAALVADPVNAIRLAALIAPLLFMLFIRMGFPVSEALILLAIVGVIFALCLPSVSGHGPRHRVRPGGGLPNPALQRTRPAAVASGNTRLVLGGPAR